MLGDDGNSVTYDMFQKKKADYDGDKLNNGDELVYVKRDPKTGNVVFKMKSNPVKKDTDGDGVNDNEDKSPKTKMKSFKPAASIFYKSVNIEIEENIKKANDSYNQVDWFEKYILLDDYYQDILSRAFLTCGGGGIAKYTHAQAFLSHFLGNTGDDYYYDAEDIMNTSNANMYFNDNVNKLISTYEETLKDKKTLCLTTMDINKKNDKGSWCYEDGTEKMMATKFNGYKSVDDKDRDCFFAIGSATVAMTSYCTRTGDSYEMSLKYYVTDFYDWKENGKTLSGAVTDGEMYELHKAGYAREYYSEGLYEVKITWKKGERFEDTKQPIIKK